MNENQEDTGPLTIPRDFPAIRDREREMHTPRPYVPQHAAPPRKPRLLPKILGAAAGVVMIAGTVAAFAGIGPRGLTTALSPVQGLLAPAQPPPHKPYIPALVPASPAKFMHPADVPVPLPALVSSVRPHPHHRSSPPPVTIGPSPVTTTPVQATSPAPSPSPSPTPSPTPSPSPSPSTAPSVTPSDTESATP